MLVMRWHFKSRLIFIIYYCEFEKVNIINYLEFLVTSDNISNEIYSRLVVANRIKNMPSRDAWQMWNIVLTTTGTLINCPYMQNCPWTCLNLLICMKGISGQISISVMKSILGKCCGVLDSEIHYKQTSEECYFYLMLIYK